MSTDWRHLYSDLLQENLELKKQIEVLESILRTHLPVVEANIIKKIKKISKRGKRMRYVLQITNGCINGYLNRFTQRTRTWKMEMV